MDKKISYTEQIKKFISGKEYAGKNIKTSDGVTSYITKTGIAKPYNSTLSDTNGCTTAIQQIDSKWRDMGIPVGSYMAQGQSCGNETSYVQSLPPKTTFDWKFYIQSNPDLHLTTEQQAYDHWKSAGIHKGLLPNPTILSSMANVGKIGYVDINTTLHNIPREGYAYTGEYKTVSDGNVTGTQMSDCTVPPPSIKYGDQIVIKFGNQFGSMNQQSILEFGKNKTVLFLRPPIGYEAWNGYPIKYGDLVTFAISSSTVKTTDCGWWGCQVGYINNETNLLSFGPGGEKTKTFQLHVVPGTHYTYGKQIKYNNPFAITGVVPPPPWKKEALMDYGGNDISHTIKPLDECKTLCENTDGCAGIVTDNSNKNHCWLKKSFGSGRKNNDRNAYISSNPKNMPKNPIYVEIPGYNFPGNDINHSIKSFDDCKKSCSSTEGCKGILTDVKGKNHCYLKSTFTNASYDNTLTNHIIAGYTDDKPRDQVKLGFMKNNTLIFENYTGENMDKIIFTFQNVESDTYVASCNVQQLQYICNVDKDCTGFIHSNKDNTWQKMTTNSGPNMYKVTDTSPNVYLRKGVVNMNDKSCTNGAVSEFIESDIFSNYPIGHDFVNNGDQCSGINTAAIKEKRTIYNNANYIANASGENMIKTYPNVASYSEKLKSIYNQMNSNTNEYKSVLTTIKKKNEQYNDTYNEQNNDLALLGESNKLHVFAWGLSSIVVIAMVVMLKNRQT